MARVIGGDDRDHFGQRTEPHPRELANERCAVVNEHLNDVFLAFGLPAEHRPGFVPEDADAVRDTRQSGEPRDTVPPSPFPQQISNANPEPATAIRNVVSSSPNSKRTRERALLDAVHGNTRHRCERQRNDPSRTRHGAGRRPPEHVQRGLDRRRHASGKLLGVIDAASGRVRGQLDLG